MSVKTIVSTIFIACSLSFLTTQAALAKTSTQLKNEQRARDYKVKKAAEKTVRKADQAKRKHR